MTIQGEKRPSLLQRTPGVFVGGLRMISMDTATTDLPGTDANNAAFGRPPNISSSAARSESDATLRRDYAAWKEAHGGGKPYTASKTPFVARVLAAQGIPLRPDQERLVGPGAREG